MYTQEIANIFDHIQGHSRLGLENKFLENKSGLCFLRSTGLLYKFLLTNLGLFKPTFYNWLLHITFEVKQYYLSYRPQTECGISQFFKTNWTGQYSGRSGVGFKRNQRSKNFQNHPYGHPVLISIVRAVSVVECFNEL